jgi:hypothetical protein
MSWRGQGGKRAKGRRGDQDPELDNTAWLAELEREAAAQADDDDEDDWASTLRGRRPPTAPSLSPAPPSQPSSDPGWAPPSDHHQGAEPGSAGPGQEPGAWAADPGLGDTSSAPDPDWSWRPSTADAFEAPGASTQAGPDAGWERYGETSPGPVPEAFGGAPQDPGWEESQPDRDGWGDPGDEGARASSAGPDAGADLFSPDAPAGGDVYGAGDRHAGSDPGAGSDLYGPDDPQGGAAAHEDHGGWRSAGVETPTGAWDPGEPVGREPDYPALFGELYRRSAAQQDPIWEAPPAVEPMPEQGHTDPPAATWPFEETTQSWEPSDRSFIWPSDELPSTQAEWDQPGSTNWLDDPAPRPAAAPEPDQTAAWPGPEAGRRAWEEPAPEPPTSPWAGQPGGGNGVAPPVPPGGPTTPAPPPAGSMGPPPDDWAAAIPTDVPAARRVADPSATRAWRPDEGADAEPGVPLGPGSPGRAPGPQAPAGERPGGRAARSRGPASGAPPGAGPTGTPGLGGGVSSGAGAGAGAGVAGSGGGAALGAGLAGPAGRGSGGPAGPTRPPGEARRGRRAPADDGPSGTTQVANGAPGTRTASRVGRGSSEVAGEPELARRGSSIDTAKGRRDRKGGERRARAWPRVVAVISWIVLVMVLCWYYVFPWLERVLPENF